MFVCDGAVNKLMENRRNEFYDKYVSSLISEAKKLKLSEQDIKQMIERGFGSEY